MRKKSFFVCLNIYMKIRDLQPIIMPTKIIPAGENLYRGNAVFSPVKALRLKKKGITQVIDLRQGNGFLVSFMRNLEQLYCKVLKIKYVNMGFDGYEQGAIPDMDFFEKINKLIDNGENTYVHCYYGKHRTGHVLAMHQKAKGVDEKIILDQLMSIGWKTEGQKQNLKRFLDKYFPEKK